MNMVQIKGKGVDRVRRRKKKEERSVWRKAKVHSV